MPPNSTKGRRLSTWIDGVIATVAMGFFSGRFEGPAAPAGACAGAPGGAHFAALVASRSKVPL